MPTKTFDQIAEEITLPSGVASDNLNRKFAKALKEAHLAGLGACAFTHDGTTYVAEDLTLAEATKTVHETNAPFTLPAKPQADAGSLPPAQL